MPLLTVATLQFLLKGLIPGVNHPTDVGQLWKAHLYGIDQFWFLQALLVVFLTVAVLEELELMATLGVWLVCFVSAVLASRYLPQLELFSLWGYLYLLPYFLLGCGLRRFDDQLKRPAVVSVAAVVFIAGIFVQQMTWFRGWSVPLDLCGWLSLSVGLGGTFLLFRFHPSHAFLAMLGAFSFSIYLFHVFPAAASRILCQKLGFEHRELLILVGLGCGTLIPIGIELAVKGSPLARRALLGLR